MPKQAKVIMIQGTASNVGKSMLTAALCRIFKQDGYSVAPFKSQNMALNAFVTEDGGEIGRAQAVQAEAAGIEPTVDMNPILLKPEKEHSAQLIVRGRVQGNVKPGEISAKSEELLNIAMESLNKLRSQYDIVVIEGAGSPAEINLSKHEIANMRVAKEASAPVLLVGSIDRGGVYAALYGTVAIIDVVDAARIKGFIINKLRGTASLLEPANQILSDKTRIPVLGMVPYYHNISIAEEDNVVLETLQPEQNDKYDLDIAIMRTPYISNHDDFDPLKAFGGSLRYVHNTNELGNPHIIILPGSKNTFSDIKWLKETRLAQAIIEQNTKGTVIIGICGGYQMMGIDISDPFGMEKSAEEQDGLHQKTTGLALLPTHTVFAKDKRIRQAIADILHQRGILQGVPAENLIGYEIHMGRTTSDSNYILKIQAKDGDGGMLDGAINDRGNAFGTYLHGIFDNSDFTAALLNNIRKYYNLPERHDMTGINRNAEYNKLAQNVRQSLDMTKIYEILDKGL